MRKIIFLVLVIIMCISAFSFAQNCGTVPAQWKKRLTPNTTYKWWVLTADLNAANFYSDHYVPVTQVSTKQAICWAAAQHAADTWDLLLNDINLNFVKADDLNDADFIISFSNYSGIETSGTAPVQVGSTPEKGAKINLNPYFQFTNNTDLLDIQTEQYRDIYAIVTHEWGHILLDGDHTDQEDESVMNSEPISRDFTECDETRILSVLNPYRDVTVKNSFGQGLMKIDNGNFETIPASGKFIDDEWRESSFPHSFTAKDIQSPSFKDYDQKFVKWIFPGNTSDPLTVNVLFPTDNNPTYLAEYGNKYAISFTNYHPGSESGGPILVDNVQKTSPATNLYAVGSYPIKGKAVDHQIGDVYFSFYTWDQQGGTSREYNFTQEDDADYVAKFEGTPTNGYRNQYFNPKVVGQPIKVYWRQHPNTKVTHYKVYRKPKYGSETCVATVNRTGTSSHVYTFTDPDMVHTNSSSSYNLYYYDVRAYYDNSPLSSGKYSDYDFKPVYAEMGGPVADDSPKEERMQIAEKTYEYGISNYPNPYNPTTTISYSIKEQGNVQITVYDALGRKVADLVNEIKQPGSYNAIFNGSNLTSGIYFYTMKVNEFMETKKMLLTK